MTLQQLRAHQIDEDFGPRREPREREIHYDAPVTDDSERVAMAHFDPEERVPSYESSQEQHLTTLRPDHYRTVSLLATSLATSGAPATYFSGFSPSPTFSSPPAFAPNSVVSPPIMTTTNTRGRFTTVRRERTEAREGKTLKSLGLKFLNARQHFLLAACRDVSLIPCLVGLFQSWWVLVLGTPQAGSTGMTAARMSEHFLTGIWCIVAGYLLYSVLDGLMVRWIVTYSTSAAIVRMLSMLTILMAIEQYLVAAFSAKGYKYGLHTWILISCALTFLYIVQNFVTSNIDLKGKRRARFFDFYNIVVFAVVPVGMASFITMVGLLRALLILRLDIDQHRMTNGC